MQSAAKCIHRVVDAAQVPFFRICIRNFYGQIRSRADLRNNKNQNRQQMRFEPGPPIRTLPPPLIACASNPLGESTIRLVVGMRRKLMPMQHYFGFRKCWDEAAYRRLIASQGWVGSAQHFMNIKSISINESLFQELPWYVETNRSQIC